MQGPPRIFLLSAVAQKYNDKKYNVDKNILNTFETCIFSKILSDISTMRNSAATPKNILHSWQRPSFKDLRLSSVQSSKVGGVDRALFKLTNFQRHILSVDASIVGFDPSPSKLKPACCIHLIDPTYAS